MDPEQRHDGGATWRAALFIAAAAAALPFFVFSGFELGVEAAEYAAAARSRTRSARTVETLGAQWAAVEREVAVSVGGARGLAPPASEVNALWWEAVSTELRSAFVEELLASRERICEEFVGDGRKAPEQALAVVGDDAWFDFSTADAIAVAGLAQTFEADLARAASNAFDLLLELDDHLWAHGEDDGGLLCFPQCTDLTNPAPRTGVDLTRARVCGAWLVRYVVDCAKEPRIRAALDRVRALQLERAAALRAAAEQWRAQ